MMDLHYPIGKFSFEGSNSEAERSRLIGQIAEAPARLRDAIKGLSPDQLATPYRPGGWTIRQVVHHIPDSHLNSYARFKLALTEDEPTIKDYREDRWAELADAQSGPVDISLVLLESLHKRWVTMLKSMAPDQFERKFRHPELGVMSLDRSLGLYAWHSRHHVAHITSLRERMGW